MDRPNPTPTRRRPASAVLSVKPHPSGELLDVIATLDGGEGMLSDIGAKNINAMCGAKMPFDLSAEFDLVASERIRRMIAPQLN